MNVAAILPCRGRKEQTIQNVKRLLQTAGHDRWRLYAIGGKEESDTLTGLAKLGIPTLTAQADRLTFWEALHEATSITTEPLICTLANDLLPGADWLKRAVAAYDEAFGAGPGMIGFNGDSHEVGHSCHFLIHRDLVARYGGWPKWYKHNFGDTELCERAIADGLYAKAPWALLYHDHPYWGGRDDTVYVEGRATVAADQQTYDRRKARAWQ